MSEILQHQPHGLTFNPSALNQSPFGSPFQTKPIIDAKAFYHSPHSNHGNTHSRPILTNYTTIDTMTTLPTRGGADTSNQPTSDLSRKKIWDAPQTSAFKAQFLPEKSRRHAGMKTLVLDMDETLLHASTYPKTKPDFIVCLQDRTRYYVVKRPHVDEFLQRMSKIYEIVIYTSGEREYATAVINQLDPKRYISYILHRDHCIYTRGGYDKDLSLIGRDLREVIFIDNLEQNLRRQLDNGIKISDFTTDRSDFELKKLVPFLEHTSLLEDVRPIKTLLGNFMLKMIPPRVESPKTRPKSESKYQPQPSPIVSQRKGSIFGNENVNCSNILQNSTIFSKDHQKVYLTPASKKNSNKSDKKQLNLTQLVVPKMGDENQGGFLNRFEVKVQHMKAGKPEYNNGDYNTPITVLESFDNGNSPVEEITPEKIPREAVLKDEVQQRVVVGKETIQHVRNVESGTLFDSSSVRIEANLKAAERTKQIMALYEKISELEQRIKTRSYKHIADL